MANAKSKQKPVVVSKKTFNVANAAKVMTNAVVDWEVSRHATNVKRRNSGDVIRDQLYTLAQYPAAERNRAILALLGDGVQGSPNRGAFAAELASRKDSQGNQLVSDGSIRARCSQARECFAAMLAHPADIKQKNGKLRSYTAIRALGKAPAAETPKGITKSQGLSWAMAHPLDVLKALNKMMADDETVSAAIVAAYDAVKATVKLAA